MDLLLNNDRNKSHYIYFKDFNRLVFNNTKCKNKKHFFRYCLQCFSSERVLVEHKEMYLEINGKQSVELKSSSIESKNHFKKLAIPFKVYVNTAYNFNDIDKKTSYTEKYQIHISSSFAYKVVCIDDKFSKPVDLYRGKNAIYKLIEAILKGHDYCKK